jgi:two-component system, LytTR family, sensor kinase
LLPFCGLASLLWGALILVTGTTLSIIGVLDAGFSYFVAATLWCPYAAASPLAIWMVRRFPIRRPQLWRSIGLHFVASLVFVSVAELSSNVVVDIAERWMGGRLPADRRAVVVEIPPNPWTRKPLFQISPVTGLPRPTSRMSLVKAQMNVPIYWVMLAVAEIVRARARVRERERHAAMLMAQLNESRLAGLRAQIQPHFLFNTLNSISVLMQRDARGANEMLLNLSELLRMSLRDDSTAGIPLREELRLLRLYAGIQRIRFSDRLRFEEEIDDEALDAQVPTLFLQPLVENALRHGIEAADGPGFVRLRIAVVGSRVSIVIENSCPADGARPADGTAATGIGLRNTAARMSVFFGDGHRFEAGRASIGLFRVEIGFDRRAGGAALAGRMNA